MNEKELLQLVEHTEDAQSNSKPSPQPKELTADEVQAAADQARFNEIMNTVEFTPAAMVKARAEQTARRLPVFIAATEQQVRRAAAMGVTILELRVGQPDTVFKQAVITYLEGKGFRIIDEQLTQGEQGFKVDLREESYVN